MFLDQIAKKVSKRFAASLFRKRPSDIARNRIRTASSHLSLNSNEFLLRDGDGDL
jgi:hypothetical protein